MTLEEFKKLEQSATPGPWQAFENGPWGSQGFGICMNPKDLKGSRFITSDRRDNSDETSNDVLFIAASRTMVPRLIEAIEWLYNRHKFYHGEVPTLDQILSGEKDGE